MNHHLEATNTGAFTLAGQDGNGMYYYHSNISPEGEAADFARYYFPAVVLKQNCSIPFPAIPDKKHFHLFFNPCILNIS